MPRLDEFLAAHARLGLDTSPFIDRRTYELEGVSPYVALTSQLFRHPQRGEIQAVTSVLTPIEVTVLPLRARRLTLQDDYEAAVWSFPNLSVPAVDRAIARPAADLRAMCHLTAIDAVQVASAIAARATALLSNDRDLLRVTKLEIVLLDDLLPRV